MQLTKQQIDYCMECGVCTGSCPISYELPGFSPRQMIKKAMQDPDGDILRGKEIWACLSCSRCSDRCPVGIDFPMLIRHLRQKAISLKNLPLESHHGIFQSISDFQTGDVHQKRTDWAKECGKTAETGDYFYFVGCLPYFDITFRYLDMTALQSARSILKILNKMGIKPVVSDNERCCGHDAFWSGKIETFKKLAALNMESILASGAKKVIFGCPEGYIAFRDYYPEYVGKLPFEIVHISEFLAEELPACGVDFGAAPGGAVTYQDPCRLGRMAGIYDAPRELIHLLPDVSFQEMPNSRENAVCCGTSAWMQCSACSKTMQTQRLEEAQSTGASTLITACDKCRIHLTCAKSNTDLNIEVIDLYSLLAKGMGA